AWQNFFENPEQFDRPTPKKRFAHDAFRVVGGAAAKTERNRVWLPKFGWLSFRASRPWLGKVTSVTFKRNQRTLARLQRRQKNRTKGTRRYKKGALRVARMQHHIACMRANRAHQV